MVEIAEVGVGAVRLTSLMSFELVMAGMVAQKDWSGHDCSSRNERNG